MQTTNPEPAPKPPNEKALVLKLVLALIFFIVGISRLVMVLKPDPAAAAYNEGIEAYAQKDFPNAEKGFEKATRENPAFVAAWMNLAMSELELKKVPAAESAGRKAVDLLDSGKAEGVPKGNDAQAMKAQAHANLGMILMGANRPKDALPEISKALEVDPANAKAQTWTLAWEELRKKLQTP